MSEVCVFLFMSLSVYRESKRVRDKCIGCVCVRVCGCVGLQLTWLPYLTVRVCLLYPLPSLATPPLARAAHPDRETIQ